MSTKIRNFVSLAFGPDESLPVRRLWALLVGAVAFAAVGWLLSDDDTPNDLGDT